VRIIFEGYKPEGLKNASLPFPDWMQHLGHAMHVARLRLKSNFDKIALRERPGKLQQSAIDRHDVNIALGLLAVA